MNRGGGATDAVVVGAGPNGLSAAIALAREGRSVRVLEAAATVGGGSRSAELTLPGFLHDVCSAVHPLGRASPFWATLPLERHGLRWIEPPVQSLTRSTTTSQASCTETSRRRPRGSGRTPWRTAGWSAPSCATGRS